MRIQHSEDEIVELGVYKTAFEEIHSGKLENLRYFEDKADYIFFKAFAPSIAEEFSRPRRKPIQTTRKVSIKIN